MLGDKEVWIGTEGSKTKLMWIGEWGLQINEDLIKKPPIFVSEWLF